MQDLLTLLEDELKDGGNDKLGFTKFEEGNTHITILQTVKSRWAHFEPGSRLTVTCPGGDCPICAIIKSSKENNQKTDHKSSRKFGMLVYNHNKKALEILDQSKTFMTGIQSMLKELKEDGEDYSDVSKFVIRVRRDGTSFNDTKYSFRKAPKDFQTPVPEADLTKAASIKLEDEFLSLDSGKLRKLLAGKTLKEIFNPEAEAPELEVDFTK